MNLEPFQKILKRAMGLAPESLGKSGVCHALQVRMRAAGCSELEYLRLLQTDEQEISELIEEIVVPETWFFRDTKPFELLSETAVSCRRDVYKVLSAPCSTGEEPYSVAMALMGAGLSTDRIKVDAVDISKRALSRAKDGIYTDNSFRSELPVYAKNCFKKCEQGRKLVDRVKDVVSFYSGNIVEGELPLGQYDAIFCRNLIIYLDESSRECLAELFNERLKKDGLLFVGHAEALPLFNKYFTQVKRSGVFAFKKTEKKSVDRAVKSFNCIKPKYPAYPVRSDLVLSEQRKKRLIKKPLVDKDTSQQLENMKFSLDEVRLLADRGETSKALSLCQNILVSDGPEANVLHLCGLLYEAQGEPMQAEEYYGKALYLNPQHLDSLVHLALLVETRGDERKAVLLRNRVRRAEKQNEAG
ncbi:chemotaxis protein methyltransferase WspC [Maridesulfovibrio ferrireducens]|uniref:Chemotaxis protein methyltransferase WspC n=1 Tax=Maridesulfovibrio ferrireducens TaxID=246191 RepID=A0A1G9CFN8_9BACT|nr:CheR family methyltransferase [Maridesulfovibrio ferrireducens]SDK50493.1 chemotaxis protein methyltransferase WspC [Maridesulfovibrio ferrireducens]